MKKYFVFLFLFIFIFSSKSYSKDYFFEEYGITFSIPDEGLCKLSEKNIDENKKTIIYCKFEYGDIFFNLTKIPSKIEVENLYQIQEDDYEKAEKIIKEFEKYMNGLKIKKYLISQLWNINMLFFNSELKVKILNQEIYRYGFYIIGISNKVSSIFIGIQGKSNKIKSNAVLNYEKLKKKYFKEIITKIVFQ